MHSSAAALAAAAPVDDMSLDQRERQEAEDASSSPTTEEPRVDSVSPKCSDTGPATSLVGCDGQGEPVVPKEAPVETLALSNIEQEMPPEDSTEMQEKTGVNESEEVFQMDPPTSSDEATTEVSKGGLPNDDPNSEANTSSQPDAARGNGDDAQSLQDGSAPSQFMQADVINASSDILEASPNKDDSAGPVFHTPTPEASPAEQPEMQSTRNVQPQQEAVDPSLMNSAGGWDNSSEHFVNRGLALWERSRQGWLHRNSADSTDSSRAVATILDVDEIIDILFTTPKQLREDGGPRAFPQPVALPQMIDILVDLWEAEGLDV